MSTQQSKTMLMELLNELYELSQTDSLSTMSEEDKFRAAYALNLCTVSVSQIIDYNDVNFMEHEYESILNNLNLEEMPKDEALLHILKQLLDVITYFRIQEGEKKLLEKEYQQKMKNAIWNAVPNIGMIVTGGNPVTMAISLASQVGIGYMNYRKEKAQIGLEQERKEWELQRSAMEQFNGLRRELFDTAWRLSKKYNFKDEYRLTERQITQFNRILTDSDDLRRYERLKYIEEKFKAYPPFWYYLGNAANAVAQDTSRYEAKLCSNYKKKAEKAFRYFLDRTDRNLLREDQLEASCALELFDLIENKEEKLALLERAKNASGNALDVLELCAMSYYKIDETQKAADLFRMLVNEDYNIKLNAQLLSGIYISQVINNKELEASSRNAYYTLQMRVGSEHLLPMPARNNNSAKFNESFLDAQKDNLRKMYAEVLTEFIKKYTREYDALCKREGNISKDMIELLERLCGVVKQIAPDRVFLDPLNEVIHNRRDEFLKMVRFNSIGDPRTPIISFRAITEKAFCSLAAYISARTDDMDSMYFISEAEADLEKFCTDNGLHRYSPVRATALAIVDERPIVKALSDEVFENLSKKAAGYAKIVKSIVNENPLIQKSKKGNLSFYIYGEKNFDYYLRKNEIILMECHDSSTPIIAIFNDRSMWDQDLVLTTEDIVLLEKKKKKGVLTYSDAAKSYCKKGLRFDRNIFSNSAINMENFRKLTDALSHFQSQNQDVKVSRDITEVIQAVKNILQK